MKKKYQSEALMVCHQSAQDLFELGIIDAEEMKEYDEGCLVQKGEKVKVSEKPPELKHVIA